MRLHAVRDGRRRVRAQVAHGRRGEAHVPQAHRVHGHGLQQHDRVHELARATKERQKKNEEEKEKEKKTSAI